MFGIILYYKNKISIMDKKRLLYFILKFVPFIIGIILFKLGIINLISSLLLFVGGYISIKNIFDYRVLRKNIDSILDNKYVIEKKEDNFNLNNSNNIYKKRNYSKDKVKIRKRVK